MNCCENKNGKQDKSDKNHNPMKHLIHMVLCCGLPIIIIMSLPWISTLSPNVARILSLLAPFICPIMMISMMLMMFTRTKKENDYKKEAVKVQFPNESVNKE